MAGTSIGMTCASSSIALPSLIAGKLPPSASGASGFSQNSRTMSAGSPVTSISVSKLWPTGCARPYKHFGATRAAMIFSNFILYYYACRRVSGLYIWFHSPFQQDCVETCTALSLLPVVAKRDESYSVSTRRGQSRRFKSAADCLRRFRQDGSNCAKSCTPDQKRPSPEQHYCFHFHREGGCRTEGADRLPREGGTR